MHYLLRVLIGLLAISLSSCGEPAMPEIKVDKRVAPVTDGFIKAARAKDIKKACSFMTPDQTANCTYDMQDYPDDYAFPADLKPIMQRVTTTAESKSAENAATVIYAARAKPAPAKKTGAADATEGRWSVLRLQLYWDDGAQPRIDDWTYVAKDAPPPEIVVTQSMRTVMPAIMLAMAFFGLLILGGILWLAKRKPQLISPEAEERKVAAITSRREE